MATAATTVADNGGDRASSAALLSAIQVAIQAIVLFATYRIAVLNVGLAVLGLWSVASAASTFGRIGDLGFAGAVPRLLADRLGGHREDTVSLLIQTAVLSSGIGTAILAAVFFWPLLLFTRHIADPQHQDLALELVVGANCALLLMALSLTFQSCLDGLGRFRQRVIVSILCSAVNFLVVWSAIGSLGAVALVAGAVAQGASALVLSWVVLRAQLPGLPTLPLRWSSAEFKELLAIGKFTQANSLLIMLFEPLSRVLAGQFGSAEFAALFDLAAKVTGNIRLVFSSASQALVPFFAFVKADGSRAARLLVASTSIVIVAASVLTAAGTMFSPLLSLFSLNQISSSFLQTLWILLLGNLVNVIGGPAFFFALGAGEVKISTYSLALQASIFGLLALLLNALAVPQSVPIAYAAAVAATGIYALRHAMVSLSIESHSLSSIIVRALLPLALVLASSVLVVRSLSAEGALGSGVAVTVGLSALIVIYCMFKYRAQAVGWRNEIMMFKVSLSAQG